MGRKVTGFGSLPSSGIDQNRIDLPRDDEAASHLPSIEIAEALTSPSSFSRKTGGSRLPSAHFQ